jgi:hypothetical protein
MKLPRPRLMGRPPSMPECNQFGLPDYDMIGEPEEQMQARIAITRKLAVEFFAAVCVQLGGKEARSLFAKLARSPKKRGQGKTHGLDRDSILLTAYDAEYRAGKTKFVYRLAKRLFAEHGRKLGDNAPAVEVQMRRLVKQREKQRKRGGESFEERRLRMEIYRAGKNSLIG